MSATIEFLKANEIKNADGEVIRYEVLIALNGLICSRINGVPVGASAKFPVKALELAKISLVRALGLEEVK